MYSHNFNAVLRYEGNYIYQRKLNIVYQICKGPGPIVGKTAK